MSISSVRSQANINVDQLVQMRAQYNDLQRQLSTGQKAATYAQLGTDRGLTVTMNAQLSALTSYTNTNDLVSNRINLMSTALTRMSALGSSVKTAMVQANSSGNSSGAVNAQTTAQSSLDELLGLLNTQAGDRYLFGGTATDRPSVDTMDHILNGNGAQAGLKQLISERSQADLGSNGLGRLAVTQTAPTTVDLVEDATTFGMKLGSATSTLSNATVTGPSGSPQTLSVDFSAPPNAGESITARFTMPDGTSSNVTLTATADSPPGANQFTIGATGADTAANYQTAMSTAIGTLAQTSLKAASAVTASNEFFAGDANNPPQRVDGPPFGTATGMKAGTAADTVIWYTGATSSDPRGSATAQVDQSLKVSYGAQANETALRSLVQNIATVAAVTVPSSDPNGSALSLALNQRVAANLSDTSQQQLIDIQSQLGSTANSLAATKTRQQQTSATMQDFLSSITGVSNEEVGSQILALQTRMQASMQTTAMLFQTSLVNYLK